MALKSGSVVFVAHVQAAIQHDADLPYRRQDDLPMSCLPQWQQRDVHANQQPTLYWEVWYSALVPLLLQLAG
jgi:hypothetical protein